MGVFARIITWWKGYGGRVSGTFLEGEWDAKI
jgi:hypothetical protein